MSKTVLSAAAAWGADTVVPRLISERENAVYAVTLRGGRKAALRLHRLGYNSEAEIASELSWTESLADRGFPAPQPIRTDGDELFAKAVDGRIATMISWVEGAPIGAAGLPLAGHQSEQITQHEELGRLLARLHQLSDEMELPAKFTRRSWDIAGFLGENPLWGRFWEHPSLSQSARATILAARAKAQDDLTAYQAEGADFGLIHADALRENVFQNEIALTLIDFDDAGFGFRMYDLTTAISQSTDDAVYPELRKAILRGYDQLRPLRQVDRDSFALFTMLRRFASLGWAVPRMAADDPNIARYVRRATETAGAYIG